MPTITHGKRKRSRCRIISRRKTNTRSASARAFSISRIALSRRRGMRCRCISPISASSWISNRWQFKADAPDADSRRLSGGRAPAACTAFRFTSKARTTSSIPSAARLRRWRRCQTRDAIDKSIAKRAGQKPSAPFARDKRPGLIKSASAHSSYVTGATLYLPAAGFLYRAFPRSHREHRARRGSVGPARGAGRLSAARRSAHKTASASHPIPA